MFNDWIHWLSHHRHDQLLAYLWGLLLLDSPRYALSKMLVCVSDMAGELWRWIWEDSPAVRDQCPTVCVIASAYNEESSLSATLDSLLGTYPRLEVVIVDDGSTDGTLAIAESYARSWPEIRILRRAERGGKASAVNFALQYTRADIVVIMDTDSHLGPEALWEIVQPFRDPEVGAVSAAVLVRDPFRNLVTWLQAYEYLQTIFLGRMVSDRLGMLSIISGAFGAFRRESLERGMGYDVGPDEDTDLTLFLRRTGTRLAYAPRAQCFTGVPPTIPRLFRQRRRWDLGEVIRCYCRKHVDLGFPWTPGFTPGNFLCMTDTWLFRIVCLVGIWGWVAWMALSPRVEWPLLLTTIYLAYLIFELSQFLPLLWYTEDLSRDLRIALVIPVFPVYQVFLFMIRTLGIFEEVFFRRSFDQDYVPLRVREATWRW